MDKNYWNYTIHDFLKDKDFLLWRLSKNGDAPVFVEQLNNDKNAPAYQAMQKAIRILDSVQFNYGLLSEKETDELFTRAKNRYKRKQFKLSWIKYFAAACIIAAFAIFSELFFNETAHSPSENRNISENIIDSSKINFLCGEKQLTFPIGKFKDFKINLQGDLEADGNCLLAEEILRHDSRLYIPKGMQCKLHLPDGSLLWLHAETSVLIPASFAKTHREMEMSGEIYADIAKDKNNPFTIHSRDFKVNVLGTEFNLKTYPDECNSSIVLVEGKVNISTNGKSETLSPNEMLLINEEQWIKQTVDPSLYTSWKDGILKFKKEGLPAILTKLSRYYNISFVYDESLKYEKCSGKLILSEDIGMVLNTLSDIFPITYKQTDNGIKISRNNHKNDLPME